MVFSTDKVGSLGYDRCTDEQNLPTCFGNFQIGGRGSRLILLAYFIISIGFFLLTKEGALVTTDVHTERICSLVSC